jgi:predicted acetyltransferase
MIRGTLAWDERFRWERHELSFAVYYHSDTEPSGYLCYKVEDETYYVMEMVYLDNEARQGLWNFIHAHFSMVYHVEGQIFTNEPIAFLLEDGEIEQHIAPYYMARIVDVEQFLMKYPFAAGSTGEMVLGIQDPMASWNHDTFVIRLQAGQSAVITREKRAYDVLLDIQTLTTMMLSYKRPRYLNEVGRLHASKEVLECLEKWIPADQPWFADYF